MVSFTSAPFSAPSTAPTGTTSFTSLGLLVSPAWFNAVNTVIPLCAGVVGNNVFNGDNSFLGSTILRNTGITGNITITAPSQTGYASIAYTTGLLTVSDAALSAQNNFTATGIVELNAFGTASTYIGSGGGTTLIGQTGSTVSTVDIVGIVNINNGGSSTTTIGNAGGPSTISVAGPITFSNASTFNNTTNINNTSGTGNTNIGYPSNTTDIVGTVNINATGSSPTAIGSNSGGNGVVIGGTITLNGSVISNANIDVVGSFTASNLNIIGNSILAGTLTVNNTTVLNGTLSVSGASLLESVTANGILSAGAGFGISAGPIVYTFVPNGATTFTILTSMVMVYYNGSGNCAYTLPSSASAGFRVEIWSGNSTGSTITSASTVNGSSGATLGTAYQRYTLVCLGGTSWLLSS
jgi:hypothetical protein